MACNQGTDEKLRKWIERMDTNQDGRITKEELKKALEECGAGFAGLRAGFAVNNVDTDGDGTIEGDTELMAFIDYAKKHWLKIMVVP